MVRATVSKWAGNRALAAGLLLAALLVAMVLAARPASASTFTVDHPGDNADLNPGDGVCAAPSNQPQKCTLRAAIGEAEASAAADTIRFNIPDSFGADLKTIKPNSPLPFITRPLTIDGYTQPGSSPNTQPAGTNARLTIQLSGENAGASANGLVVRASNSSVRGLVINRFSQSGVLIDGATDTTVQGNFIGTDSLGTQNRANSNGVLVARGSSNLIGGATFASRNLISANGSSLSGAGVSIEREEARANRVEGNLIGTQADGASALGNVRGVLINFGASGNSVGGTSPGVENTIAFNTQDGVAINNSVGTNSTENRILSNSIFSNGDLGIDLLPSGPTPNDPSDADSGPNNYQNFPTLTSASTLGTLTVIKGTLESLPSRTFRVQIYSNPSGEDEGKRLLGEKIVSTDSSGAGSFTIDISPAVPLGENITATATSTSGDTSEFSEPLVNTPASTTFTVNTTGDGNDANPADISCDVDAAAAGDQCSLRAAIQEANNTAGANDIAFDIPDTFGTGVKTIEVTSPLPMITGEVTIDGYTQPGATENTSLTANNAVLKVELDGERSQSDGLTIDASNVVVRGLVINRFDQQGIFVSSGANNRIEGNFIGTDPSGTEDMGNRLDGVVVLASDTVLGGTSPETHNLVSANGSSGVFIGGEARGTRVQGNLIGTTASGTEPLGNSFHGVRMAFDSSNTTVGGAASDAANTIAFNEPGSGVVVADESTGNRILSNSIFSNGLLGIDLGANGRTPNDRKDRDLGPNDLQNFPVLSLAETSRQGTTIRGKLNSAPGKTFTLQFFSNPAGADEGETFIGQKRVTTSGEGNAAFTFKPARKVLKGHNVTATATDPEGNTSELSRPLRVVRRH